MSVIICAVTAMSVALVYANYRANLVQIESREKRLRERVTYMLWVMANSMPECP
jgi:hypothetical protein